MIDQGWMGLSIGERRKISEEDQGLQKEIRDQVGGSNQ